MEKCFVNFSNHRSENWGEKQRKMAETYGEIVDVPFPSVDPTCSEEDIEQLGNRYLEVIKEQRPTAVLCQGEFSLAYYVVSRLRKEGIVALAACSKRNVLEKGNEKISRFEFERFRMYID